MFLSSFFRGILLNTDIIHRAMCPTIWSSTLSKTHFVLAIIIQVNNNLVCVRNVYLWIPKNKYYWCSRVKKKTVGNRRQKYLKYVQCVYIVCTRYIHRKHMSIGIHVNLIQWTVSIGYSLAGPNFSIVANFIA